MKLKPLALMIGAALALSGCNDSSSTSSTTTSDNTLTGQFIDAEVKGLGYRTASQSGTTDAEGKFKYKQGESVIFSIGELDFPTVAADAIITPLTLGDAETAYNSRANNIARLLQTLDSDGNPNNGIEIPAAASAAAKGIKINDWADTASVETKLGPILAGKAMVNSKQAADHLQKSLAKAHKRASLKQIARFSDKQQLDESVAEIVSFHAASKTIFVINANDKKVDAINAENLNSAGGDSSTLTLRYSLDVAADITSITAGGINSVAVSNNLMAVAVQNKDKQAKGVIAFYNLDGDGNATFQKAVEAGALPDNVAFTPNGSYAISANEGEPSADYKNDPEGSVTIVKISDGIAADTGVQLGFADFNSDGSRAAELDKKVRISHPKASVAQDLEPEYIAVSDDSKTAYVSLQENNAIAVIDIKAAMVKKIIGLGYKDHSAAGNGLDASDKDDAINIQTYPNLKGLYMPDTIVSVQIKGQDYILSANEGDSREYFFDVADEAACTAADGLDYDKDDGCLSWIDETRVKDLTLDAEVFKDAASLQDEKALGRLKTLTTQGDSDGDKDNDTIYSFGSRSFSIWNAKSGEQVFDSADQFEQITAQVLGSEGFNSTDDKNKFDNRSDDKGPEPEALAVGKVRGNTYAFIGLERTGGIMMYEISNPAKPAFVEYLTNRDFSVVVKDSLAQAGDLAPEGMKFVKAEDSPTGEALLIVGNEVSGTTTVYEVK